MFRGTKLAIVAMGKTKMNPGREIMIFLFALLLVLGLNSAVTGQAIHTFPGNSTVIVAAPHAQSDAGSGDIAMAIGKRTGFAVITVDNGRSMKTRFNVNRPTIGGGLRCSAEPRTDMAQAVYEDYRAKVLALNPRPTLYVEIHGVWGSNDMGAIQGATKGIERDEALRLKQLYEQIRDKQLTNTGFTRYDLLIQPVDKIRLTASCAKKIGIFRDFAKVLHMELPEEMRMSSAWEAYSIILANFLTANVKPGN
jgi:hypothetical protein